MDARSLMHARMPSHKIYGFIRNAEVGYGGIV